MNTSVYDYYHASKIEGVKDPFHEIVFLGKNEDFSLKDLSKIAPTLPKGWEEISKLDRKDRIEFVRDFWLSRLPFKPHFHDFIASFFSKIEDLGVFLIKDQKEEPYRAEMVYSLNDEITFFRGNPPILEESYEVFKDQFDYQLPADFLAFLQIHDGWSRNADSGIFTTTQMPVSRSVFQVYLRERSQTVLSGQRVVDPTHLIPFYRSGEFNDFQCFYADWSPYGEMGNVCFFDSDFSISDVQDVRHAEEQLAFPSFSDWLMFYLDEVQERQ